MWTKFQKRHPRLYEAVEWGMLAVSVATFLLALAVYLRG